MIRHLRAIVWLRWRLLANSLKGGQRRDTLEQVSRIFAVAVPVIVVALSSGSIIALGIVGFIGGQMLASLGAPQTLILLVLRGALLVAVIVTLAFAVMSPSQSAMTQYTRLLLLPIHRRVLHLVEVVANLADPWLLFAAVAMGAFAAGLASGGSLVPAIVAAAAGVLLLCLLASLATLVSFVVASLLRNRRRGEIFTLVFIVAVSLAGMVPAFFARNLENESRRAPGNSRRFSAEEFDANLPVWTNIIPTELTGRTIGRSVAADQTGAAIGLAMLGAEALLLFAASGIAHRRLIESIDSGRASRRAADARAFMIDVPLISPKASVVAWAQFKTAMRSLRGRLAVLIPGPLIAMMSILVRGDDEAGELRHIAEHGYLVAGVGLIFCLYTIQPFSVNMFGIDRAGLTLQFLSPLRDRDLAWGKVAGCGLLFAAAGALAFAGAFLINPTGSPFLWLSVVLGAVATYLLVSPFSLWLSALFPVAADMSKSGSGGNPHPLSMIVSLFLVLLAAAPVAIVLVVSAFWIRQPALGAFFMMLWLGIVCLITIPLIRLAARAIGPRRENLLLVAQRK